MKFFNGNISLLFKLNWVEFKIKNFKLHLNCIRILNCIIEKNIIKYKYI